MKVIGLTGSIGMGKSVAAGLLRRLGVPVHDADVAVHDLLAPGGKAFETVALTFPEAWDKKRFVIDRQKLGELVFKDPAKKRALEKILHPLVQESQQAFIRKARRMGMKKVVLDIPLLYETGADRHCDAVICVTAPYFLQRTRVMSRRGMTEEKFFAILSSQWPDIEKRRRASVVIQTGLGRAYTMLGIKKFLRHMRCEK
jgi:dephospho-CoA kinase